MALQAVGALFPGLAAFLSSSGPGNPSIYSPLSPGENIRILTLRPGTGRDPILCDLSPVSLADDPPYEALSYVWSLWDHEGRGPVSIRVNGAAFQVSALLSAAFRRLRRPDRSRTLWVDAICINQDDGAEKNHQVPLMGAVYSEAERVLVWLGEDPLIEAAFRSNWRSAAEAKATQDEGGLLAETAQLRGWFALASHPYWTRMWTFQEFRLAENHPLLICGAHSWISADIHSLRDLPRSAPFQQALFQAKNGLLARYNYSPGLQDMISRAASGEAEDRNRLEQRSGIYAVLRDDAPGQISVRDFHDLLLATRMRSCSNPRDKIYALYGLVPAGEREILPVVDYSLPAGKVFWDISVYIARRDIRHLASIYAGFQLLPQPASAEAPGCPSWVPGFGFPRESHLSYKYLERIDTHSGLIPFNKSQAALSEDGATLLLQATPLGLPVSSPSLLFPQKPADVARCVASVLRHCRHVTPASPPVFHQLGALTLAVLWMLIRIARKAAPGIARPAVHGIDWLCGRLEELLRDFCQGDQERHGGILRFLRSLAGQQIIFVPGRWVGLADGGLREGDEVVIGRPFPYPVVVRATGEAQEGKNDPLVGRCRHAVVGFAYVHGLVGDREHSEEFSACNVDFTSEGLSRYDIE